MLKVISISHINSPIIIREKLALNEHECKILMLKIKDIFAINELLVLSTCNRTEIYYISHINISQDLVKVLASFRNINSSELNNIIIEIDDEQKALIYTFEVGTGLHSKIIGDSQIPNQIKNAYQWSLDIHMAGPYLHRLMHSVFFVNKRVVQETGFRDGTASTSYAAVDTIETFLPLLNEPKILVVGLGKIGRDVIKTLVHKGYQNFTICNRTLEKAQNLSTELGCDVLKFESLSRQVNNYNIIISSVMAPQVVISLKMIDIKNQKSVRYFVDLSIPKSIDPEIERVNGMVVFDLDEIQNKANIALEKRLKEVPCVQRIIAEAVDGFNEWSSQMLVSPTIHKLKNALENIRQEEMSRYVKSLSEEESIKLDQITSGMIQKIMKLPVIRLKAACKRGQAELLINAINDIFVLDKVYSE